MRALFSFKKRIALIVLTVLNLGLATLAPMSQAYAVPVDFETIPGGTPSEGLSINTQYLATEGIAFSLEGGGFPVLADVGGNQTAFAGPPNHTGSDNPVPGQGIGAFFLTDDGVLSGLVSPPLIVSYNTPTSAASGVILDIDFNEAFTIEARDATGIVLQTITLAAGDPNTGDGIATSWSFDRGVSDVFSIRFVGTRTAPGAFGLGFDNFYARSVTTITCRGRGKGDQDSVLLSNGTHLTIQESEVIPARTLRSGGL